ncbi:IclR family transcriptional regulator domain-containing protein [Microbacterium sp. MAHUQ-60]|uniref:IclR family transcriptional regulator domain-containing protein n=1 Tax=unclassified Microbacterium TaxID=2609290 RepID=UPI00361303FA
MTATDESPAASSPGGDYVQSLARGLAVIKAFDGEPAALSLAEVARRAGIPRAAARRFLRTLEQLGYLRAVPEGRYAMTPRVLELGYGYLSSLSLPEIVQPHLEDLSRQVGESVSVAVLDGDEIVYVARAAGRRIISVRITIGTRLPAFATSMGRVLLSARPETEALSLIDSSERPPYTPRTRVDSAELTTEIRVVREQGWAMVDGELEEALRSIAVPLRSRGEVVAAVNVSTSTGRESADETLRALLPALTQTATAIEAELRVAL